MVMTLVGMVRKTAPSPRRPRKTLTRKRAMSPSSKEKSTSLVSWNWRRRPSDMMSNTMLWTSSADSAGCSSRFMSPWMRTRGGSPAVEVHVGRARAVGEGQQLGDVHAVSSTLVGWTAANEVAPDLPA